VAVNWSVLFTPAFGSYLHAVNWRTLGESEKRAASMAWFYFSLAMLAAYVLMREARLLYWLHCLGWYFANGRAQAIYVKRKYGAHYARRSWVGPLLIGAGSIIILLVCAYVLAPSVRVASE